MIYFTNVACRQLNIKTCQCRNYARRFEYEPDCIKLTRENLPTFEWLPADLCLSPAGGRQASAGLAPAADWLKSGDARRTHLRSPYCGA